MKKPIYKRWWFYVIVVIVLFGIVGAFVDKDSDTGQVTENSNENEMKSSKEREENLKEDNNDSDEVEEDLDKENEENDSDENLVEQHDSEIVAAAKMALDRFISNYDISLAPQRWTLAKFDDKNAVIGMTRISWKDEKHNYIYVGTLNFDDEGKVESATPHFLAVGNRVLGDDGYCDDVFSKLEQIFKEDQ